MSKFLAVMVIGSTNSGKSTIARIISDALARHDIEGILQDGDMEPECRRQYEDEFEKTMPERIESLKYISVPIKVVQAHRGFIGDSPINGRVPDGPATPLVMDHESGRLIAKELLSE